MRFSLARVDSVSKRTGRLTHRVLHGYDARRKRAKRESRARDRAFSLFVCATIVKKNFNEEPFDSNPFDNSTLAGKKKKTRVRGLKNAERRKAHNDAAADDDDEKEEEENKGEKESRKARREKIPP